MSSRERRKIPFTCGRSPGYNTGMEENGTLTEADILSEIIDPADPAFSESVARALLTLRFSDAAAERIRDLLQRNNAGTLTAAEKMDLEKYMRVGQFLDLFQAKARLSLTSDPAARK